MTALVALGRRAPASPTARLRVALLADTSSQVLAKALRGVAHSKGFAIDLFEADFDQIELQVFNPNSELRASAPETVIIYFAAERLADSFHAIPTDARQELANSFVARISRLRDALLESGCQIIVFNLANPGDAVFGNFTNRVRAGLTWQIRSANLELMRLAEACPELQIYDLERLQAEMGRAALYDDRLYYSSKMALTTEACRFVARDLIDMAAVRKGGGRKCVILDLDNTLWGGVIGDDGMERIEVGELGLGRAFSRFQGWLLQLRQRGIVLAVCSKNDDAVAREPFLKHPEMVLRLGDIAMFVANWGDKATNIREIREVIDVDYSAMVFLDDNPVERALVKQSFPTMAVPELPPDPCQYLSYLQSLNLFETASFTAQDADRTEAYQTEYLRRSEREKFVSPDDFLASLEMRGTVCSFTPYQYPRVAQLTQRSNQFNLRTVRYSESQIAALAQSAAHRTFSVELSDKFGDYGLISVVILERQDDTYFVETWLMSCRVLGRGVERLVLNKLVEAACSDGVSRIVGEYLPTAKNGMVAGHYEALGFAPLGDNRYVCDVRQFQPSSTHIAAASS